MSHKQVVERYIEGFRLGDPAKVLDCLADDVVWRLHGCQTFAGKAEFAGNIDNDEFRAMPSLAVRELIEEGDRVVAVGSGAVEEASGALRTFSFCELFLFRNHRIGEVDTFHVWNPPGGSAEPVPAPGPAA